MSIPFRQIHLDFHTSPLIPDVGADFDAEQFAATLEAAHVESINIFAKCHHGMHYYPSKIGPVHPSLKFDLLGQMIGALHRRGIKCPIYTTVVWDEHAAESHAEWLQLDSHGKIVGREPYASGESGTERWRYLCLNTGYLDYFCAHVDELLDNYDPDGFWFDIMMYSSEGCSCSRCIRDMISKGLDPTNPEHRRTHAFSVLRAAMDRISRLVRGKKADALVFFNGRQFIDTNPERSFRRELGYFTHLEIESLPSGAWGYNHFPMFVRYSQIFGKEIVGMNGKFHKSWADFGGFKNKAALEYECFNMLAGGARVCVGDQLHPRGRLDKATYDLVGAVFEQIAAKEPWCVGAVPVANIGLMAVNDGEYGRACRPVIRNLEAAMQMLLEDHRQFHIIDGETDLSRYQLVVFPDRVRFDPALEDKVQRYVAGGGKVILSHESGLASGSDTFAVDVGGRCLGDSEYTVTYLRFGDPLQRDLAAADYVMYERGKKVLATDGETLAKVVHPYFERSWEHFMSHQQTPPDKESPYAAAVRKGNVVYFACPVFRAYKKHGNLVYKKLVSHAIDLLLPEDIVTSNLPSTARVTVLDQGPGRRIVHLLHYPIERRSDIDLIEDVVPLYGIDIRVGVPFSPGRVYLAPQMEDVAFRYEKGRASLTVPSVRGHQMVVLEQ